MERKYKVIYDFKNQYNPQIKELRESGSDVVQNVVENLKIMMKEEIDIATKKLEVIKQEQIAELKMRAAATEL